MPKATIRPAMKTSAAIFEHKLKPIVGIVSLGLKRSQVLVFDRQFNAEASAPAWECSSDLPPLGHEQAAYTS
jgi:hypothetical protein